MGNLRLRGKDLSKIGLLSDTARSIAISIVSKHLKHYKKDDALQLFTQVLERPESFVNHPELAPLAKSMVPDSTKVHTKQVELLHEPKPCKVFGNKYISPGTRLQMEKALLLPIAERGALLPDAHEGYGLPIGGVLATRNAIIPYGVGLDIGCRMSLTIFQEDMIHLKRYAYQLKTALKEHTHFGIKGDIPFSYDHEVLERKEFMEIPIASKFHGKAIKQLGTSGSGNHFVEFGIAELNLQNRFNVPPGRYVALLSHSGSRGFGAEIAKYYTNIAMNRLYMPKGMQHLAWLDLNTEAGEEYWQLMSLAGDYAKACHDTIHSALTKALGLSKLLNIENHHNFAWKEMVDGQELIVHRKGATPAGEGVTGIIPGSMTQPGYIVSGKGNAESLCSASHGAGRKITRTKAKNSITMSETRKLLKQKKVTLIGGGVDESPYVYKDLDEVMLSQSDLVNVEGSFIPQIVRMDKS